MWNNPAAKYNQRDRKDCNLDLPLWQLVRASTAAPVYFPPEVVKLGRKEFIFVDGGITTYNNPAFQLFLMATLPPYRLCWECRIANKCCADQHTYRHPGDSHRQSPGADSTRHLPGDRSTRPGVRAASAV